MADFRTHPRGNRNFDEADMGVEEVALNLADSDTREKFVRYVEGCEAAGGALTPWEEQFVEGMRTCFDSREDAMDMGQTPWNPSVNQWNTLHGIWSKV